MSNEAGPNFIGYFKHLTSELLMDNEMLQLTSSEFKKEKLKTILNDSVDYLMRETDRVHNDAQALHWKSEIAPKDLQMHSDALQAELDKMEQELEEYLNTIFSKCRPMGNAEKEQLGRLMKMLPEKALDHVVKIITCGDVSVSEPSHVFVDLSKQNDPTLWRLYYYTHCVLKVNEVSNCSPMPLPLA